MGGLNAFLTTFMPPCSVNKHDILADKEKYNMVKINRQIIDIKRFVGYEKIYSVTSRGVYGGS